MDSNRPSLESARMQRRKIVAEMKEFERKNTPPEVLRDKARLRRLNTKLKGVKDPSPFFNKAFIISFSVLAGLVVVMMIIALICYSKNKSAHQAILNILNFPWFFLPDSILEWKLDPTWIFESHVPTFWLGLTSAILELLYIPIKLVVTLISAVGIVVFMLLLYVIPYAVLLVVIRAVCRWIAKASVSGWEKEASALEESIRIRDKKEWLKSPEYKQLSAEYDAASKLEHSLEEYERRKYRQEQSANAAKQKQSGDGTRKLSAVEQSIEDSKKAMEELRRKEKAREAEKEAEKEAYKKRERTYHYVGYKLEYRAGSVQNVPDAFGYHDECKVDWWITLQYKNENGKEQTETHPGGGFFHCPVHESDVEKAAVSEYKYLMKDRVVGFFGW